jgi:hypothetical protein
MPRKISDQGDAIRTPLKIGTLLHLVVPQNVSRVHKAESHRSEQKGFANLVRGAFGMFRNVTAHQARILWAAEIARRKFVSLNTKRRVGRRNFTFGPSQVGSEPV